jgi:hypothetical protein
MSATTKLRTVLWLSAVIGAVTIGVPALAPADNGCPNDLVPRLANPYDPVCVTKQVAAEIAQENANAANLRDPNGAYGPNTCKSGYVWREAFEGDAVCVAPERRQETWKQNAAANMGPTGGMPLATQRAPIATLPTSPKGPVPTSLPTPTGSFKPTPTQSFKPTPTQSFKPTPTESFKPTPTGAPHAPPAETPGPSAPPHPGGTTIQSTTAPPATAPKPPPCDPRVDICVH